MGIAGKKHPKLALIVMMTMAALACSPAAVVHKRPPASARATDALNKGIGFYDQGCYQRALSHFWIAHEQFCALDQNEGVAASLNSLGNAYRHLGDPEQAEVYLKDALRIYRQIPAVQNQVLVMANLAAVCMDRGRLEEAADYLRAAEQLPAADGLPGIVLFTHKGILQTRLKDYANARNTLQAALSKADPNAWQILSSLQGALGSLEAETGRLETALKHYQLALATDRSGGFYRAMADDLDQIGQIYIRLNHPEPALDHLLRSLKLYALLTERETVARLLDQCEALSRQTGQDIQLAKFFAHRWLEQGAAQSLCP
jgi:tetratricopeptide (TPR) repeat protein